MREKPDAASIAAMRSLAAPRAAMPTSAQAPHCTLVADRAQLRQQREVRRVRRLLRQPDGAEAAPDRLPQQPAVRLPRVPAPLQDEGENGAARVLLSLLEGGAPLLALRQDLRLQELAQEAHREEEVRRLETEVCAGSAAAEKGEGDASTGLQRCGCGLRRHRHGTNSETK